MSKRTRPKIRNYTIPNIPKLFLEKRNAKLKHFINFLPINLKYYKVISHEFVDSDNYQYYNLNVKVEKLQNLKSYVT